MKGMAWNGIVTNVILKLIQVRTGKARNIMVRNDMVRNKLYKCHSRRYRIKKNNVKTWCDNLWYCYNVKIKIARKNC
jgi:hypothetical protein